MLISWQSSPTPLRRGSIINQSNRHRAEELHRIARPLGRWCKVTPRVRNHFSFINDESGFKRAINKTLRRTRRADMHNTSKLYICKLNWPNDQRGQPAGRRPSMFVNWHQPPERKQHGNLLFSAGDKNYIWERRTYIKKSEISQAQRIMFSTRLNWVQHVLRLLIWKSWERHESMRAFCTAALIACELSDESQMLYGCNATSRV